MPTLDRILFDNPTRQAYARYLTKAEPVRVTQTHFRWMLVGFIVGYLMGVL